MAAVENHTLEVIDLKSGRQAHTIPDLAEPQAVFYDAATQHLFVACALDGVTKVFDGTTFELVTKVNFSHFPTGRKSAARLDLERV